jgi:tRNA threonylcarbamoyladenosine biosynthesis protein TsaB
LLVEDAGAEPQGIETIVVSRGPGSFTGIRSGLASAAGLAAATGAEVVAFDSLLVQAARSAPAPEVWAAQPGRRGEVYAQRYRVRPEAAPTPLGEIEILRLDSLVDRGPWMASDSLDLGAAVRGLALRGGAEALLELLRWGGTPQEVEPLYVEGPPIQRKRES